MPEENKTKIAETELKPFIEIIRSVKGDSESLTRSIESLKVVSEAKNEYEASALLRRKSLETAYASQQKEINDFLKSHSEAIKKSGINFDDLRKKTNKYIENVTRKDRDYARSFDDLMSRIRTLTKSGEFTKIPKEIGGFVTNLFKNPMLGAAVLGVALYKVADAISGWSAGLNKQSLAIIGNAKEFLYNKDTLKKYRIQVSELREVQAGLAVSSEELYKIQNDLIMILPRNTEGQRKYMLQVMETSMQLQRLGELPAEVATNFMNPLLEMGFSQKQIVDLYDRMGKSLENSTMSNVKYVKSTSELYQMNKKFGIGFGETSGIVDKFRGEIQKNIISVGELNEFIGGITGQDISKRAGLAQMLIDMGLAPKELKELEGDVVAMSAWVKMNPAKMINPLMALTEKQMKEIGGEGLTPAQKKYGAAGRYELVSGGLTGMPTNVVVMGKVASEAVKGTLDEFFKRGIGVSPETKENINRMNNAVKDLAKNAKEVVTSTASISGRVKILVNEMRSAIGTAIAREEPWVEGATHFHKTLIKLFGVGELAGIMARNIVSKP